MNNKKRAEEIRKYRDEIEKTKSRIDEEKKHLKSLQQTYEDLKDNLVREVLKGNE